MPHSNLTHHQHPRAFPVAFRWDLAHGRCVGVAYGRDDDSPAPSAGSALAPAAAVALAPEERRHLLGIPPRRRAEWAAGRLALRGAAADLGVALGPLLPDAQGRPQLPPGMQGSISHKAGIAVGLFAVAEPPPGPGPWGTGLGVDLEERAPARPRIATLVLTPEELRDLEGQGDPARWEGLLLRFSLKEALYKALSAIAPGRWGFRDATVTPHRDGAAAIQLHRHGGRWDLHAVGAWRTVGDLVLTTVRVEGAAPVRRRWVS